MDRRDFLKSSLIGAGVAATLRTFGSFAAAADKPAEKAAEKAEAKPKPVLKLCSQDGKIPGSGTKEKAANILKYGGCGLEFGGMSIERAKQIKKDLEGTGVGVAALCWGRFSLMDPDEDKRKKAVDDLKKALEVAAEAGSTGVVVVPNPQMEFEKGRDLLIQVLGPVGEHGVKVGSRVLLEPLNKGEAKFMNRLEQAAEVCNKVNSPGVCMMGDFYHMCKEEKNDKDAFVTAGKWLHHVHLASRVRWLPGMDKLKEPDKEERSFVEGFRGLKLIGYQDYCSLECGWPKDTKPEEAIPKSFEFLKKQWEEATI